MYKGGNTCKKITSKNTFLLYHNEFDIATKIVRENIAIARGRRGNVRRDSMGRYSRDEAKTELMENLREMKMDAKTEKERHMIDEWIRQIEQD